MPGRALHRRVRLTRKLRFAKKEVCLTGSLAREDFTNQCDWPSKPSYCYPVSATAGIVGCLSPDRLHPPHCNKCDNPVLLKWRFPIQNSLGCRKGLLAADVNPDERGNGHVARNVRLALMVVDVVQPYVQWQSFSNGLVGERCEPAGVSKPGIKLRYYFWPNCKALIAFVSKSILFAYSSALSINLDRRAASAGQERGSLGGGGEGC